MQEVTQSELFSEAKRVKEEPHWWVNLTEIILTWLQMPFLSLKIDLLKNVVNPYRSQSKPFKNILKAARFARQNDYMVLKEMGGLIISNESSALAFCLFHSI